jgi:hypothetical protein
MNISPIVKLLISAAWKGLEALLISAGVPMVVVSAVEQVLVYFGLIGNKSITKEEMIARASKVASHMAEAP